jgi:uncharacterized protein
MANNSPLLGAESRWRGWFLQGAYQRIERLSMRIEGSHKLSAPRETVYERLLDPASLAKALPGCEKLEPQPDGSFAAHLRIGIASVKGNYQGRVEIHDQIPPESFRMNVEGKGAGGFMKGEGTIKLAEEGSETVIHYSGEAQVGGLIASVGQRMMQAAAKQIVNQFFESFAKQIQTNS